MFTKLICYDLQKYFDGQGSIPFKNAIEWLKWAEGNQANY